MSKISRREASEDAKPWTVTVFDSSGSRTVPFTGRFEIVTMGGGVGINPGVVTGGNGKP